MWKEAQPQFTKPWLPKASLDWPRRGAASTGKGHRRVIAFSRGLGVEWEP